MRQYRTRNLKHNIKKGMALLIIGLGSLVYLYLAGKLGVTVGHWLTPMLTAQQNDVQQIQPQIEAAVTQAPASPSAAEGTSETNAQTETIDIGGATLYCIQIGAFSDHENAEAAAYTLRSRGAAGYIIEDDYWRVLASGYQSLKDAEKVKENLENGGIENTVYQITYGGFSFEVTADTAFVDEIKALYQTFGNSLQSLHQLSMKLDTDQLSAEQTVAELEKIKSTLSGCTEKTEELIENLSGENRVLTEMLQLSGIAVNDMQKILDAKALTKVELSSLLKYNTIDMFLSFKSYVEIFRK